MPVEGRNLSSELTLKAVKDGRLGNLATPMSVQKLQTALHAKAKEAPEFGFYALYDKIYRMDVLTHAYACCRANKGASGVDGLTFDDIGRMDGSAGSGNWHSNSGKRHTPGSGKKGLHSKTKWQAQAAWYSATGGKGVSNGGNAGLGAHLRGRFTARTAPLPAEQECAERCARSTRITDWRLQGYRRRRPIRLFRHDPACRTHEIGSTPGG